MVGARRRGLVGADWTRAMGAAGAGAGAARATGAFVAW